MSARCPYDNPDCPTPDARMGDGLHEDCVRRLAQERESFARERGILGVQVTCENEDWGIVLAGTREEANEIIERLRAADAADQSKVTPISVRLVESIGEAEMVKAIKDSA